MTYGFSIHEEAYKDRNSGKITLYLGTLNPCFSPPHDRLVLLMAILLHFAPEKASSGTVSLYLGE
jgi:hypothetical protein